MKEEDKAKVVDLLSGISGYLQLLKRTPLDEEQRDYIILCMNAVIGIRETLNGSLRIRKKSYD